MTPTDLLSFSRRTSTWFIALAALLSLNACQGLPTRTACPSAQDMSSQMLYGRWSAQIEGEPVWSLTLGPHSEHVGSLRGELTQTLNQHTQRRAVVADLDDGEFTLEETHDGQRIAATWQGHLPNAGCGRQIQGHRSMTGQSSRPFLITRQP
jgi:hypothetical protein